MYTHMLIMIILCTIIRIHVYMCMYIYIYIYMFETLCVDINRGSLTGDPEKSPTI